MDTVYTQAELDSRVENAMLEASKDWESRYNALNVQYVAQKAATDRGINLTKENERRWFAESVMDYDQGSADCRYQFLEAIGLEGYVSPKAYTFTLTVTAAWDEETEPGNMLDDLKSTLENYNVEIDDCGYEEN